jgi:hypothetical protein
MLSGQAANGGRLSPRGSFRRVFPRAESAFSPRTLIPLERVLDVIH